jgi:hypothetical protein
MTSRTRWCATPLAVLVLTATACTFSPSSRAVDDAADVQHAACVGGTAAPALDHVVIVVRDIEAASAGFAREGFRLKRGRLHANNLLNRHIKFRDGTGIELMTVAGEPGDAMAGRYVQLLRDGEGGVYVALAVTDAAAAYAYAEELGLQPYRSESGAWRFVAFDAGSSAAAVFFVAGGVPAQDPDSILDHAHAVTGLAEAWLEAGPELGELLQRLDAAHCGRAAAANGMVGERIGLGRGSIIIVPPAADARPRVHGVVLQGSQDVTLQPHRAFRVQIGAGPPPPRDGPGT